MIARALAHFLYDKLADAGHATDAGNTFVHAVVTQVIARIDIIYENPRFVVLEATSDPSSLGGLSNPVIVSHIYSLLQDMPGNCSINRA
jgi:hypothetical protein